MATSRYSLSIRPASQSLVRDAGGNFPSPCFIIECSQRSKELIAEVEMGSDPLELFFNSRRGIPGLVPPVEDLRLKGGGAAIYQVPSRVWDIFLSSPRIFYRAVGRSLTGTTISSFPEPLAHELPFLHGRPSDPLYHPSRGIADLPRLLVAGNGIRREGDTAPFLWRGVNISGLNHARYFHADLGRWDEESVQLRRSGKWLDAAYITPELMNRLKEMNVNLVRLPLNQDWVLMGYHEPELPEFAQSRIEDYIRYLEDVDQAVAWAAERGMYVLLALHTLRLYMPSERAGRKYPFAATDRLDRRLEMEARKEPYNGHLPDHRSWLFWSALAQRYRGCSAVMFDLCNEPHEVRRWYGDSAEYRGALPPFPTMSATTVGKKDYLQWWKAEWKRWAEGLEEVVHRINKNALVFISGFAGPCWSSSLENMQINSFDGNPNIIYAVHWYWSPELGPATWRRYLGMEVTVDGEQAICPLAQEHPVFVMEWGVETPEAITQESSTGPPSRAYKEHWKGRSMPDYGVLMEWGESLAAFFAECMGRTGSGAQSGFAGFAAWSTGDKPRIFNREGVHGGAYKKGFPTTDYGRLVEKVLAV